MKHWDVPVNTALVLERNLPVPVPAVRDAHAVGMNLLVINAYKYGKTLVC